MFRNHKLKWATLAGVTTLGIGGASMYFRRLKKNRETTPDEFHGRQVTIPFFSSCPPAIFSTLKRVFGQGMWTYLHLVLPLPLFVHSFVYSFIYVV